MKRIKKYITERIRYAGANGALDSLGQGNLLYLEQLRPENRKLLEGEFNRSVLALVMVNIEEFFLESDDLAPALGLDIITCLTREVEFRIQGFCPFGKLVFVDQVGIYKIIAVMAIDPKDKVSMTESAAMLRLSLRDNLNLLFSNLLTGGIELSVGVAYLDPSRGASLGPQFFQGCVNALKRSSCELEYNSMPVYSEFRSILKNRDIKTRFQPVVDFASGMILGWEAFSAGPEGSVFQNIETMLAFAEATGCMPELDSVLCSLALERIGALMPKQRLFMNVHPSAYGIDFSPENLKKKCRRQNIAAGQVVIELDERNIRKGSEQLLSHMGMFQEQGFQIGLDDVGGDLSNFKFISRLRPDYLKVDISLIGGIDTNPYNRLMLETLSAMGESLKANMIAVGIETETEFSFLVSMGVHGGQGHFLAKPSANKVEKTFDIPAQASFGRSQRESWTCQAAVGELAQSVITITPDTTVSEVKRILDEQAPGSNIVVVEKNKPVGLLMKYGLDDLLSTQYGNSLYYNRPVSRVMDSEHLMVEADLSVEAVAQMAMQRPPDKIYDDIVVVRKGRHMGVVSVQRMLDTMARTQVEMAKGANPLSGLPGNVSIEREIEARVAKGVPASLAYVDLDNFKVYNDAYGFDNGDRMILLTAKALSDAQAVHGGKNEMIGHVGGDDFIVIGEQENIEAIMQKTLELFAVGAPMLYNEEDRKKGHISGKGRDGKPGEFGLVSLSIGILDTLFSAKFSMETLSLEVAKVKKEAKAVQGNSIVRRDAGF